MRQARLSRKEVLHKRQRRLLLEKLESRVVLAAVGDLGLFTQLDQVTLEAIGETAAERWRAAGLTAEQSAALDAINYGILDLGGDVLGAAQGYAVLVDDDAAGKAWFVDATPAEDEEFVYSSAEVLFAETGLAGDGAIDLLTTVMHEQGHVLGLLDASDDRSNLMFGSLSEGERRLPVAGQAERADPGSVSELAFIKLNEATHVAGDIQSFLVSPDSSWVVYLADGDTYDQSELYSRPIDGSGSEVKLNDLLPFEGRVNNYRISPDSSRVVFTAQTDASRAIELYSLAIDGSGIQVKLNDPLPDGASVQQFQISPDASRVVYLAAGDVSDVIELYSRAIDGSGSEAKLNDPLPLGGDVRHEFYITPFRISPDSSHVVYRAEGDHDGVIELYSRPIDGSGIEVKLNEALASDGDVLEFQVSNDSSMVVYQMRQTLNMVELYSRPINGSGIEVKLNDPLRDLYDVLDFQISPDSSRVVYRAQGEFFRYEELYSKPIDGSGPEIMLNNPPSEGSQVEQGYQLSPDSTRVVYIANSQTHDLFELYSSPIDGSAVEVKLNDPLVADGRISEIQISPDSSRVVYRADGDTRHVQELYTRPIDGSGTEVKLNDSLPEHGSISNFVFAPDSSRVLYAAAGDLYSRASDGSGPQTKLNDPLPEYRGVGAFQLSADSSRVVYTADRDTDNVRELFSRASDGSGLEAKLNEPLALNSRVYDFQISPDSTQVVYMADGDTEEVEELFSRPIDGSAPEVKLNDPLPDQGRVYSFEISPDSSLVLYTAIGETRGVRELYGRAIDGSGSEFKLNDPLPTSGYIQSFEITPDGSRVMYTAKRDPESGIELYSRAIDGSGPEIKVNEPLTAVGSVVLVGISPDSSWAVYRTDRNADGIPELYSRAIDGSGPEVTLADSLPADNRFRTILISPDSSRVVYLVTSFAGAGTAVIYSRAIDGSGPQFMLNDPLPSGGFIEEFLISPDSSRVVYRADGETDDVFELYSTAIDGSSPEVTLNDPLPDGGDVGRGYRISPDSTRVVFGADGTTNDHYELYSREIGGSGPQVKLNDPLPAFRHVGRFLITPDSSRVLFTADRDTEHLDELYSRAIDGTGSEIKLTDPTLHGDVDLIAVSPDSYQVVYSAVGDTPGVRDLYSLPTDGSGVPVKINDPFPERGFAFVIDTAISPDSSRMVYSFFSFGPFGDTDVRDLHSVPLITPPPAPPVPAVASGPEAAVNDYTTSFQDTYAETRAVAVNESGDYIVAFSGWGADDTQGIFARRFDSDDTPLGPQFRVNETTAGNQRYASAAIGEGGQSVVAWSGRGDGDNDGGVFIRLIDNSGTLVGGEIRVNETTASAQQRPNVAIAPDGSFIVVWSGKGVGDFDSGVFARRFAADGSPISGEFRVNTTTFHYQQQPDIAIAPDGSFVITWSGYGPGVDYSGVYFQRYDAGGTALGGETRVNMTISGPQVLPSVGIDSDGNFAITWSGMGPGDLRGVFLRRFDATGNPIGDEERVNTTTLHDQEDASVSVAPSGIFVVTWTSSYQDGSGRGVYGQEFDQSGAKLGGEFLVSNTTVSDQKHSSVATKGDSGYVVAWSGRGTDDRTGVYIRSFNRPAGLLRAEPLGRAAFPMLALLDQLFSDDDELLVDPLEWLLF